MALDADFKERFPQFDEATVDSVFPFLAKDYLFYYNVAYVADSPTAPAVLMLLAHLFVVETSASDGQANQLSSTGVRSVNGTFHLTERTTNKRSFLNSTKYGQRFLLMTEKRQGAMFV